MAILYISHKRCYFQIEVGYADDMSLKMTVSSNAEKDDTIVTPEIPTGAADITDLFVSAIKTKNN